jgi:D-sedoheptulose 7-phosphate isomerase
MIEYLKQQKSLLETLCKSEKFEKSIKSALLLLVDVLKDEGKILIAGNGGSASQASHFAGELVGRFELERKGLPAIALSADNAVLTAWGNDYSFETVFERQLQALGRPGDVFVGLSTSGNSKNIIKAVEYACANSIKTICFLGRDGGALKGRADVEIIIPHDNTARIQEVHLMLVHALSAEIEKALF